MSSPPTGSSETAPTAPTATPKLQAVNYANIVAFVANLAVTYGVGVSGYFPTNAELSAKYQSLVTPAGYAFSIWGVIFISQFVWTIFQALAANRSSDLVIRGVGYWYVWVCVAQCTWSIVFAYELIEVSLGAMLAILVGLAAIVQRFATVPSDKTWKYFVFKFPFEIHCGWIWAASVVNANVVLVSLQIASDTQVIAAWVSLAFLAVMSAYYLLKGVYVVPLVLAWASTGVYVELQTPQDSIANAFDEQTIQLVSQVALGLAITVGVSTVLTGAYQFYKMPPSRTSTTAEEGATTSSYSAM